MGKIYTKTGDDGNTGLRGNVRVGKDSLRLEAYGDVDEVNAAVGVLLAHVLVAAQTAQPVLTSIQSDLFLIGASLSTPPQEPLQRTNLSPDRVRALEEQIDKMEAQLKPLTHFILPQGAPACALAHLARSICRRAERHVVALSRQERVDKEIIVYLNRLSDYLFVLARWINVQEGGSESVWTYSEAEGAKTSTQKAQHGDRLGATLKKLETEKEQRKTLFEKASQDLQKKKDLADKLFRQNVDQIHKEGGKVEKPLRDMDLD